MRAILRLAQKFSSEPLRTFAVGRLQAAFPRRFADWEELALGGAPDPLQYGDADLVPLANLAQELELDPRDPEPQIVAHALMGLWELRESCMGRHIDDGLAGRALQEAVQGDVARAARVLETGLLALHVVGQGRQIAGAARAMNDARKEIAGAVRDARSAWRAMRAAQLERVVRSGGSQTPGGHGGHRPRSPMLMEAERASRPRS